MRATTVLLVLALVLGVLGSRSSRTDAQGESSPTASPLSTSSLAFGAPNGIDFNELLSGEVDSFPSARAILRLDRLLFSENSALGKVEATGPEIIYVET